MLVSVMNSQLSLINISLEVGEGEFWALDWTKWFRKINTHQYYSWSLKTSQWFGKVVWCRYRSFKHRERIGYVSQKSNSFNSGFPATVLEVVRSGLTRKVGLFKSFSKKDEQRTLEALRIVGMERFCKTEYG